MIWLHNQLCRREGKPQQKKQGRVFPLPPFTFSQLLLRPQSAGLFLPEFPTEAVVPQGLGATQALKHSIHEALEEEIQWGYHHGLQRSRSPKRDGV